MLGSIVLAGGASSRMGTPKAALMREGVPLLRAVVEACPPGPVVVVGPSELSRLGVGDVVWARENPPGGGPVPGLVAGLAALDDSISVVQVLPCDTPRAAHVVRALDLVQASGWQAIVPVDGAGWPQFLMGRYERGALSTVLGRATPGASVRRTVALLERHEVRLPAQDLADLDDPAAARAAGWWRQDA